MAAITQNGEATNMSLERGFTYIGLLIMVALIGIALAATAQLLSTWMRRDREVQLLFVGDEFRKAISSYYLRTPGANKKFPKSMQELLSDSRFPNTVRHLRKIYVDPLTGKAEWGVVRQADGGITAVHSLSQGAPLKRAGFERKDESFAGADKYSQWLFTIDVNRLASGEATASAGSAGGNVAAGAVDNVAVPSPAASEVPASESRDCADALILDLQTCARMTRAKGTGDAVCNTSARQRNTACVTGQALPLLRMN
jgi:type II secretory pathway pseudopilin PulG